ncbi:alpha-glucosidase [Caulobacter sp. S45]|uniref:alpha-glucosidase n=1 Tax=Caulobacter sp. S45 TaxID=1641861 RepID=UPI00131BB664|nr:alpha-glucosidase [Caulobacter sp. S45]
MTQPDTPWWKGAVIYQVYPRSFQDSDGDGDGVGDLKGIIARLPYIASLGVDGIWLSPVFASPMADYGYDIADYRAIDPLFGTLTHFDALVAAAHALGLKLIVDQVYSHTSDKHAWFAESRADRTNPKADWYVWADARPDGSPPNNWQAVFGGSSWTWDGRRQQYYLHNFLAEQPDLNFHTPAVQNAVLDVARFWLDRGVDGFRLDVANCFAHDPALTDNPPSHRTDAVKPHDMQLHIHDREQPEALAFAARLRALVDEQPGRMTVAELFSHRSLEVTAAFTGGPYGYHTAYNFLFLGERFGAAFLREGVETLMRLAPEAWPSWAFSNHDVIRVATRWGAGRPQPQFAKLLFALLTALRGTAFVYQGEELGLPQAEVPFERLRDPNGVAFWPADKGRDGCRTPMPWIAQATHGGFSESEPWLPLDPAHRPLAVDLQAGDPQSMLAFVRRWLAWRRGEPAMRTGDIAFLDGPAEVLAFFRGGERLCLFNLGETDARFTLPVGDWRVAFDLSGRLSDGDVELAPASGLILASA